MDVTQLVTNVKPFIKHKASDYKSFDIESNLQDTLNYHTYIISFLFEFIFIQEDLFSWDIYVARGRGCAM